MSFIVPTMPIGHGFEMGETFFYVEFRHILSIENIKQQLRWGRVFVFASQFIQIQSTLSDSKYITLLIIILLEGIRWGTVKNSYYILGPASSNGFNVIICHEY